MRDPGPTDEQAAMAEVVARLGAEIRAGAPGPGPFPFPSAAWRRLGELGVLGIASTEGGGAGDVLAVNDALGAASFPGPISATLFALQILDPDAAHPVSAGDELVSVCTGRWYPWGNDANWLLVLDGAEVGVGRRLSPGPATTSLTRATWAQPVIEPVTRRTVPPVARVLRDLAVAGYLSGAARACLADTAAHARQRRQFGRSLGEFQAVSHALARCDAAMASAAGLARQSAWEWDHGSDAAERPALARRACTSAALDAVLACHQVFGAMGFSEETGLWRTSTAVRELSLSWPDADADALRAARAEGRRLAAEGARWRSAGY